MHQLLFILLLGVACGDEDEDEDTAHEDAPGDGGAAADGGTTADGGAAAGPAPIALATDCDPDGLTDVQFAVDGDALLRVIGVYASAEETGKISVRVDDERPTTLVLSSYEAIDWVVLEATAGTVQEVIASAYSGEGTTVDAPAGVTTRVFEGSGQALSGSTYSWSSESRHDLVASAMELTGSELASYTGCSYAGSFVLSEGSAWPAQPEVAAYDSYPECADTEPIDVIEPPDTSLVTGRADCAGVVAETAWCLAQADAGFVAVGMDTGETCDVVAHDGNLYSRDSALAWSGSKIYYCGIDNILTEVDLVDGSVRWADRWCGDLLTWEDELWIPDAGMHRYDSFHSARCGTASLATPYDGNDGLGQYDNQMFAHWFSTDTIEVWGLPDLIDYREIVLEGFRDYIYGVDQVDGDLLIVNDSRRTREGSYHLFDSTDGSALWSVTAPDSTVGLVCFNGG